MSELPAQTSSPQTGIPARARAEQRLVSSASTSTKIKRLLWSMVESTLFRGSFHTMNGWRCFLLRMFGAKVGRRCIIRRTVRVYYPWLLEIGDMAVIGDVANLYNLGKITIGTGAMISQEAYLCAGTHDYTDPALPLVTMPVTIGKEAWICARAFVSPGITVGEGAIVAACGVAVKNVDPWTIVGGNPAKFIKKREMKTDRARQPH
jgi:putative colanic acid biosynthesis acetyltransferase WcaF